MAQVNQAASSAGAASSSSREAGGVPASSVQQPAAPLPPSSSTAADLIAHASGHHANHYVNSQHVHHHPTVYSQPEPRELFGNFRNMLENMANSNRSHAATAGIVRVHEEPDGGGQAFALGPGGPYMHHLPYRSHSDYQHPLQSLPGPALSLSSSTSSMNGLSMMRQHNFYAHPQHQHQHHQPHHYQYNPTAMVYQRTQPPPQVQVSLSSNSRSYGQPQPQQQPPTLRTSSGNLAFASVPSSPLEPSLSSGEAQRRDRAQLAAKVSVARADTSHQCSICLDEITHKTIIIPCFHQFCHLCIFEWYKAKSFCPVCRQEVNRIIYNIQSDIKYEEAVLPMATPPDASSLLPGIRIQIFGSSGHPLNVPDSVSNYLHMRQADFDGSSQSAEAASSRSTRVILVQMLAILAEKYPHLGFPTSHLTLASFRGAVSLSVPDVTVIPELYRCYLYLHKYAPLGNFTKRREAGLAFLQENPALRSRLLGFLRQELVAFKRAFTFSIQLDKFLDSISHTLAYVDVRSEAFRQRFHSQMIQYSHGSLRHVLPGGDLTERLLDELLIFAKAPYSEHADYVLNVQYVSLQSGGSSSSGGGPSATAPASPDGGPTEGQPQQQDSGAQQQPEQMENGQQEEEEANENVDALVEEAMLEEEAEPERVNMAIQTSPPPAARPAEPGSPQASHLNAGQLLDAAIDRIAPPQAAEEELAARAAVQRDELAAREAGRRLIQEMLLQDDRFQLVPNGLDLLLNAAATSRSSPSTSSSATVDLRRLPPPPNIFGRSTSPRSTPRRLRRPSDDDRPIEVITISSSSSEEEEEEEEDEEKAEAEEGQVAKAESESSEIEWIPPVGGAGVSVTTPSSDLYKPGPSGLQASSRQTSGPVASTSRGQHQQPLPPASSFHHSNRHPAAANSCKRSSTGLTSYQRAQFRNGKKPFSYSGGGKRLENGTGPPTGPKWSRYEVMQMRRTIRNAPHSHFFYRKLLFEIQKKASNYRTVLNSEAFSDLEEAFREIHVNYKLYQSRRLGGAGSSGALKKAHSLVDLQQILSRSKKAAKSGTANGGGGGRHQGVQDELSTSETDQDPEIAAAVAAYESEHRETLNQQVIQHAMKPSNVMASFLGQLKSNQIQFANHLYTSSDSEE